MRSAGDYDAGVAIATVFAEGMMHWLWAIIIGFVAGAIARWIIPAPGGCIVTTVLGIAGAAFASWLGQEIGWYGPGEGAHFIGAVVGAVLILAIYRALLGPPRL